LKENEEAIMEACKLDIGKSSFETYVTETGWCMNDIVFVTQHLEKWMKDESAPDIALMNKFLFPKIRKDPMGAVLVIGYASDCRTQGYTNIETVHTTSQSNFP
jgi:beta-apo-4'-carotenal oxygenase